MTMDAKLKAIEIFIDLKKPFVTIDHSLLLKQIWHKGWGQLLDNKSPR